MSEAQQTAIAELLHVVEMLFAADTPETCALALIYMGRVDGLQTGQRKPYTYLEADMAAAQHQRQLWREKRQRRAA